MPDRQSGDEQHPVFECPALQGIKVRCNGLFGYHATTTLQFIWQHDTRAVAQFIRECVKAPDQIILYYISTMKRFSFPFAHSSRIEVFRHSPGSQEYDTGVYRDI